MESILSIYKIGKGPSSSHTMAPQTAGRRFISLYPGASRYEVTLYGSLAATGKGHLTDIALQEIFGNHRFSILWEPAVFLPFHPNAMKFACYGDDERCIGSTIMYSIGGGDVIMEGEESASPHIYPFQSMSEILIWCEKEGRALWEFVEEVEGKSVWDPLHLVWSVMQEAIARGLEAEGVLPGGLGLRRKASSYYVKAMGFKESLKSRGLVYAYALAVSEENASGGTIVTAPTCGSCGVLPAVLFHLQNRYSFTEIKMLRALATAALLGNIVKHNASISGADVGCQGEVGTACAMAAGAANQLFGGSVSQIEYAAEMGLEHHLGLTCDPVCGLVQIPCIERNAFAAARALDSNLYASISDGAHRVSFDKVVAAMRQTGHDLPSLYKETSEGGLASAY